MRSQKVICAVRPFSARTGTMIFPSGTSDTGIILKLPMPKGIPMIVMHESESR